MRDSRRLAGPGRDQAKERLWRQHITQQRRGKLSVRAYCAQAGISEPSFYAWRRELTDRDAAAGSPRGVNSAARFLPVAIRPTTVGQVEVVSPSGLIVRIPAQDAAALRTVLELLERPAC